MEKAFKAFCVFMTVLLLLSSVMMVVAVSNKGSGPKLDLFSCNDIVENINNLEMNLTSIIYVQNEKNEWVEYQRLHGEENRIWVDIDKIPKSLIDAAIAIEDERFNNHNGVDWKRTFAAFANTFLHFLSSKQGGSTITQQLIKNLTGDDARNSSRKIREIFRALILEKKLKKSDILEAYLNTISLGNGFCGVQVAANYYFNKDVSELSLVECAAIAAITKNPSAYNPETHPDGNRDRRRTVLDKMYELGKISYEEYSDAYDAELVLDSSQRSNFEAPVNSYFVDALIDNVIADLSEKYGCSERTASTMFYNGGYKIYATVDLGIQSVMEEVYLNQKKYFSQISAKKETRGNHVQSAMTVMDYEGHILGIVGGVGEKTVNRGLNRATDSPRQPGSTMKPLGAYAPAIDRGQITYSSYMVDSALDNYYADGKKGPKEWYGYYAGNMTIQKAIERSANTIPCKIVRDMGINVSFNFLTQSLKLNHLTDVDKNLAALALGGCEYGITTTESAAAYAIFGNHGKYFEPVTYYKVERATGEIVLQCNLDGTQVIQPATASIMNMLLQNVVYGSQGTGRGISSYSKMKVYAKTGTSSESNDLWMVAGTPYYVGSVWYGFDQKEPLTNAGAAATVWKAVMTELHKNLELKEFEMSQDIIEAKYCRSSGLLAGSSCYSTATGYYVPNVEVEVCNGKHSSTTTDNSSSTGTETSSTDSSSGASSNSSGETSASSGESSGQVSSDPSFSEDSSSGSSSSEQTSSDPTSSNDTSSGDRNSE